MNVSSLHSTPTSGRLDGKTVLIVGGTSGIGLSAAIQASAIGARVIVTGFNSEQARDVAATHGFAGWRAFDITDEGSVAASVTDLDRVDHLVVLAGSFVVGKVLEAELSYLRRAFDERVWGALHVLRALGGRLARDGSVTFISGVLADRPNAMGTAVIASASAAMEALARGLAVELAPLRVNALSPGTIDTPLLAKALGEHRAAYVAGVAEKLPVGRVGAAEDAGAAILFLITNGFVSGETLHVDGGARLV
ncbi:SDR family oxidoreductase [Luteibacter sp. 329MFSha]|uniref:SDR family oxidoreductase n=1 Tax=Luteibacter sp. 329MFSha TaxID=1798239 RepID=UPI0008CE538A|nr:SDR family oxidoreductase [Luteibacter sp. 329MFSha]SEV89667.1 NAD(P)-dependent dehydrogenase, short-chain alcohol dehydrogenase family [Luteibacter sp. 329MFSha]